MAAKKRHGHAYPVSPTYNAWRSIIGRCKNESASSFKYYGGRGIKVCLRWHEFSNFLEDMGERPVGKSIDRIDNDGDYEPGNCRWATSKEQANNRRSNAYLEFGGERMNLEQWAERIGIPSNTLWMRLYDNGWTVKRALTTPLNREAGRFVKGWRKAA